MYNKYFTMKRSELKEAIKNEITSVLTENKRQERYDALNDNEQDVAILNNMTKKYGKDVVLYWLNMFTNENYGSLDEIAPMGPGQTTTLSDFEDEEDKFVRVSQKDIRNQLDQYENGKIDGDDLANGIEQIVFGDIAPRGMMKEDEMSDAEKKKAAEKDAKKEKDFANKQKEVDKLKKELADNKDELVKIAKISRNERTKAQQNLFDDMAKKTKELKKLKRVEI